MHLKKDLQIKQTQLANMNQEIQTIFSKEEETNEMKAVKNIKANPKAFITNMQIKTKNQEQKLDYSEHKNIWKWTQRNGEHP